MARMVAGFFYVSCQGMGNPICNTCYTSITHGCNATLSLKIEYLGRCCYTVTLFSKLAIYM